MKQIYQKYTVGNFFWGTVLFLIFGGFLYPSTMQAETNSPSGPQAGKVPPARQDTFMGTGNSSAGGFTSTYTDPQTGDIITRVIPPAPQQTQQQPVPIYIYPQVEPQWPPKNNAQPQPVPVPRVPAPSAPKPPSNPSLYIPNGQ